MDFRSLIQSKEYDFLRADRRLGRRIMVLGPGGSYAYGTNNENSDIDIRGITLNLPSDILGLTEFEQYEDQETDTVVYSFNKMVGLLLECNPNTCEILGLDREEYLILIIGIQGLSMGCPMVIPCREPPAGRFARHRRVRHRWRSFR